MRAAISILSLALISLAGCQKAADTTAGGPGDAGMTAPTTPGLPTPAAPAPAPAPTASIGQGMDAKGEMRMDVTEAVRSGGVMTIKARFTLTGGKSGSRALPGGSGSGIYLSAADKKYMLLKDDAGKELMSTNYYPDFDKIGSTNAWWGKFPAPSPDVKALNVYFTDFEPVENVPITDR